MSWLHCYFLVVGWVLSQEPRVVQLFCVCVLMHSHCLAACGLFANRYCWCMCNRLSWWGNESYWGFVNLLLKWTRQQVGVYCLCWLKITSTSQSPQRGSCHIDYLFIFPIWPVVALGSSIAVILWFVMCDRQRVFTVPDDIQSNDFLSCSVCLDGDRIALWIVLLTLFYVFFCSYQTENAGLWKPL